MGIPVLIYSVYVHKNKINQKIYIGVTKQAPEKRFQNGYGYKYSNPVFWEDIQKYGWKNFEHLILVSGISKEMASIIEQELIAKYESQNPSYGYNQQCGGFTPTRPEISELMKRRIGPLNPNYGKKAPEKTRKALLRHAKECQFGANNPVAKAVQMFDRDGQYIRSFSCIVEAQRFLKIKHSHIAECCRGKRKSSNGFVWKYERSEDLSESQF